jgi:hypothetical protein
MKRLAVAVAAVLGGVGLVVPIARDLVSHPRPHVTEPCWADFQTGGLPPICIGNPFPERL